MANRGRLIALIVLAVIIGGTLFWSVQTLVNDGNPPNHPSHICDVTISVQGTYYDFSIGTVVPPGAHVLVDWHNSAYADNWRFAQNLELLAVPYSRVLSSWPPISVWGDTYTIKLTIQLMQNGQVAKDITGNPMTYTTSFTVAFSPLQSQAFFLYNFKASGVPEGVYLIKIDVTSGQYILLSQSSATKSVDFAQGFIYS